MSNMLPEKANKLVTQIIDNEINISVINKIELLGFSKVEQVIIEFVSCSNIYPINDAVVNKTIELRRLNKIKLPDALIAASAIINKMVLISRNTKDFKNIHEFEIIDPYLI